MLPKARAQLDIDTRGRLVENQHVGAVDHRLGDHQAAAHAARQAPRVGIGMLGQVEGVEDFVGAPPGFGHAIETGLDFQGFARGEERVDDQFLRYDTDCARRGAAHRVDVMTPDFDVARGLVDQPGENIDESRFAGAVGPEQAEYRAARHVEIDPLQRLFRRLTAIGFA